MSPGGRSARRARSTDCGRNCTSRPPARQRPAALLHGFGHGEAHLRGDLLRLAEILVRGLLQALAFQGDDALIAAGGGALVDGHGQVAGADQVGVLERSGAEGGHPLRVEARGGAQAVRRLEIDHDHRHRTVGLGLELEPALELQRGAEQHRERRSLAEQPRHRIRVAVAAQDRVDGGAEPDDAPAHVQRLHGEGQHGIVRRRRGRCPRAGAAAGTASVFLRSCPLRSMRPAPGTIRLRIRQPARIGGWPSFGPIGRSEGADHAGAIGSLTLPEPVRTTRRPANRRRRDAACRPP